MTLLLATHNLHKRDELRRILIDALGEDVLVMTLDDITPPIGDIEETGTTLEENALIKARTVFEITGIPTIADDTGLEVDALGGAPGVYSARYAGIGVSYQDNVLKLLGALDCIENRRAKFSTVIAYIIGEGGPMLFRGEVEGTITREQRGEQGFGYDPIFAPIEDAQGRTFAELSIAEKNQISHRARAIRKMAEYLKQHPVEGAVLGT